MLRADGRGRAVEVHREVLDRRTRVLGADDLAVIESKHELALALWVLKQRKEAWALWREVIAERRRVQGPDHEDTLAAQEWADGPPRR